jgi:hypothetical protein
MSLKYTADNVSISLQRDLAIALKAFGYNVLWRATGETEAQNMAGLGTAKGTVTLTPEFPANPAYLVKTAGLNDGSVPTDEEIQVPAFTLVLPTGPKKIAPFGLGDSMFERQRGFRIEGFAWDEFQQRELMDFFYNWLEAGTVMLPVWDYASNPASPPALAPVEVIRADVQKAELIHEVEAIRYYVSVTAIISYYE